MAPRATYRLQFHERFTFDDAAELAPYLAKLGVSHLYASPFFKAHPGSTHGYDVVDYGTFNPELGGEAAFKGLAAALKANGLKLILDFVPNHMGVGGADNAFWLDLLEWGQEADHAGWFDVEWATDRTDLRKVLVPVLGDQYGAVLEAGDLVLRFDAEEGAFAVWAHGTHKLPVCPLHYETILGRGHRELADLGDSFADLMHWRPQIMRRARDLKAALAVAAQTPTIRAALDARVAALNGQPGAFASWQQLAALIERQNWKPAHFLVAADDINYRRFFNIATLAGLRMELPAVFDHAHGLVFSLMEDGLLDGLRIDHIDGLYDPRAYLERLRREAPGGPAFYLVVEKILGPDEPLPEAWPVEGTTGYDFTNLLTSLFVNPASEAAFTRLYEAATGETQSFEAIIFASKLQIIDDEMSSELHRLARAATRVARGDPHTADFTLTVLQRALRLLVASFPVYRTYVDGMHAPTPDDRRNIDRAIGSAGSIDRAIDPSVFAFLRRLLTGDLADEAKGSYRRADVYRCVMKMQQYCGPVMAKGVEDTAFYRYDRFVALNEVGGSPDRFGITVAQFHAANQVRAERWPCSMLATSTHDTKRGEDTRARLAALSVIPAAWEQRVRTWSDMLQAATPSTVRPDRNDRYLLFQLLVGTWPVALAGTGPLAPAALDAYIERLKAVLTKSMREAKRHSTWTTPDEAYEAAMASLIEAALAGPASPAFLADFRPFADEIAERGARNTFAQTVLKLTVPGMPDIYQGAEGWDLSMVDPDNRRPIDYAARQAVLDRLGDGDSEVIAALWADWRDGAFKLALTHRLLALRRRKPDLFARGSYHPLPLADDGVCAFLRVDGDATLLVVAQRFPDDEARGSVGFVVPDALKDRSATSMLTGAKLAVPAEPAWSALSEGLPASVWLFTQDR